MTKRDQHPVPECDLPLQTVRNGVMKDAIDIGHMKIDDHLAYQIATRVCTLTHLNGAWGFKGCDAPFGWPEACDKEAAPCRAARAASMSLTSVIYLIPARVRS